MSLIPNEVEHLFMLIYYSHFLFCEICIQIPCPGIFLLIHESHLFWILIIWLYRNGIVSFKFVTYPFLILAKVYNLFTFNAITDIFWFKYYLIFCITLLFYVSFSLLTYFTSQFCIQFFLPLNLSYTFFYCSFNG